MPLMGRQKAVVVVKIQRGIRWYNSVCLSEWLPHKRARSSIGRATDS